MAALHVSNPHTDRDVRPDMHEIDILSHKGIGFIEGLLQRQRGNST